mmetsp:Transcript_63611/g.165218  ORF Transcript_63611/g.165218 Transcript_63611/m.165218 type:complete len:268 (+) Transcript_63611:207-1010(+)
MRLAHPDRHALDAMLGPGTGRTCHKLLVIPSPPSCRGSWGEVPNAPVAIQKGARDTAARVQGPPIPPTHFTYFCLSRTELTPLGLRSSLTNPLLAVQLTVRHQLLQRVTLNACKLGEESWGLSLCICHINPCTSKAKQDLHTPFICSLTSHVEWAAPTAIGIVGAGLGFEQLLCYQCCRWMGTRHRRGKRGCAVDCCVCGIHTQFDEQPRCQLWQGLCSRMMQRRASPIITEISGAAFYNEPLCQHLISGFACTHGHRETAWCKLHK